MPSAELEDPLLEDPVPPKPGSTFKGVAVELRELGALTAGFFVSSVSWVIMKTTDTALLGHVGTRYLDASALSDLYTQSTGVFIQGRVLGIFVSQAYGAGNYALAGAWLQTSYVVLAVVALPVVAAWSCTGLALRLFGVDDATLRNDAAFYAWVLMACIPARVGFSQLTQFFSAQKLMRPSYATAPVAMVLNLVLGLALVLGVPFLGFDGFGFPACPAVTSGVEFFQLALVVYLFCYRERLQDACRPDGGWLHLDNVTRERCVAYAKLYVPAALSIASDFWRVAAIGAVAATLSKDDLGVFNASYRIMWICLTFIGSLGGAVSTKLGIRLGANDAAGAKKGVYVGLGLALAILAALALVVVAIPRELGSIFTSDPTLLDVFEEIRVPLATTVFTMNAAVVFERVPMAMGRTRAVLILGFAGSWVGQVPAVLLCVNFWKRDLVAVYTGVSIGYALLTLLLGSLVLSTDYDKYAKEARDRSEMPATSVNGDDDDA